VGICVDEMWGWVYYTLRGRWFVGLVDMLVGLYYIRLDDCRYSGGILGIILYDRVYSGSCRIWMNVGGCGDGCWWVTLV